MASRASLSLLRQAEPADTNLTECPTCHYEPSYWLSCSCLSAGLGVQYKIFVIEHVLVKDRKKVPELARGRLRGMLLDFCYGESVVRDVDDEPGNGFLCSRPEQTAAVVEKRTARHHTLFASIDTGRSCTHAYRGSQQSSECSLRLMTSCTMVE